MPGRRRRELRVTLLGGRVTGRRIKSRGIGKWVIKEEELVWGFQGRQRSQKNQHRSLTVRRVDWAVGGVQGPLRIGDT